MFRSDYDMISLKEEVSRKVDRNELYQIHSRLSNLERSIREISSLVNGLYSRIETNQNEIEQLKK